MASATAAALDAADGVIDGRHFGRPIVQAGAPAFGGFAQPAFGATQFGATQFGGFAQPVQTFGAVQSFGAPVQSFGTTFATQPAFFGGASSTAAALDAADGVIDGRHFGRPIVQAGAAPVFQGAPVIQGASSFVQRPAIIGAPVQTFGATQFGGFAQPAFGGVTQFAQPTFGGVSSTAAALDAADGVIDGRHFGRPIVQAGAAPIASYGTTFGAPQVFGTQFGAPVQTFGATQFGGFPTQVGGFPQAFGAQSRAAQLDAADGVIDGKFYGRQIVQRR